MIEPIMIPLLMFGEDILIILKQNTTTIKYNNRIISNNTFSLYNDNSNNKIMEFF